MVARHQVGGLPAELTSFIGRKRELDEIKRLLSDARLVTLTGIGGTGKTRLALRVAAQTRRRFADGAWFVELGSVRDGDPWQRRRTDPQVLARVIVTVMGLPDQSAAPPMRLLTEHLARRRALLVLDSCEPVLPAATALVDTLLRACPGVRILATSRESLHIVGEWQRVVEPLTVPDPARRPDLSTLSGYESVALFVARARQTVAHFRLTEDNRQAVEEICHRLDGLPLAIELAAARLGTLRPQEVAEQLTDRFAMLGPAPAGTPDRQQTLRACIDWSFELCTSRERLLWARLSVFVSGFELDAAEGVCADDALPADELVDVLASLIDKSTVDRSDANGHGGRARYKMLDTIRGYGGEQLGRAGEQAELRRRHRDWYTGLVARAEADWISVRQPDWLERLDRELPNIRAALQYSLAAPDGADTALAVAVSMRQFWFVRRLPGEGRSWLDQALARPTASTMERLKALYGSASLASMQGDLTAASTRVRQGHELAAQIGDARAHGIASAAGGLLGIASGDPAAAVDLLQRGVDALATEQAGEYLTWRVSIHAALAMAKAMRGDIDGAAACHDVILALCQAHDECWFSGISLYAVGLVLWKQGDLNAAAARLKQALTRLHRINETLVTCMCLDALAWIAYDEGRHRRAATLIGAVTQLSLATGTRPAVFASLSALHQQYEQRTRNALREPAYQAAYARGVGLSLDEAVDYALNTAAARRPVT